MLGPEERSTDEIRKGVRALLTDAIVALKVKAMQLSTRDYETKRVAEQLVERALAEATETRDGAGDAIVS